MAFRQIPLRVVCLGVLSFHFSLFSFLLKITDPNFIRKQKGRRANHKYPGVLLSLTCVLYGPLLLLHRASLGTISLDTSDMVQLSTYHPGFHANNLTVTITNDFKITSSNFLCVWNLAHQMDEKKKSILLAATWPKFVTCLL